MRIPGVDLLRDRKTRDEASPLATSGPSQIAEENELLSPVPSHRGQECPSGDETDVRNQTTEMVRNWVRRSFAFAYVLIPRVHSAARLTRPKRRQYCGRDREAADSFPVPMTIDSH